MVLFFGLVFFPPLEIFLPTPLPVTTVTTCYCYYRQFNHSKEEAIPLSALPNDNKQTCWPIFTLSPFLC